MKKIWTTLLMLSSFAIGLVACDMKKQLTEMHDSTGRLETNTREMGDTTKSMDQTTQSMYDTTKLMAKTTASMHETTAGLSLMTAELVDLARMNDSSTQRRQALQALKAADSLGLKINEAAKYFSSFEYQLFNGIGQDITKEKRTELQNQAVAEFFKSVKEFDTGTDVTRALVDAKSSDESNKDLSFNALAAVLHLMNRKQMEYLKTNKLNDSDKVSMLGLIVSSLEKKDAINKGEVRPEDVPEYTKDILANERIAVRLLQARVTVFTAIACGEMSLIQGWPLLKKASSTKVENDSVVGRIAQTIAKAIPNANPKWDLNIDRLNLVQIQFFLKLMNEVTEGRAVLEKLGTEHQPDQAISTILKNLVYVEPKSEATGPLLAARQTFKTELEKFLATQKR